MKFVEWLIALSLIIIGLSCLTMSATWILDTNALHPFFNNFMHICMWTTVPIIVVAFIYLGIKWRQRRRK